MGSAIAEPNIPPAHPLTPEREIVESFDLGFLGLDTNWRILDCNGVAERFLECRRDDLVGVSIWEKAEIFNHSPLAELLRRVRSKGAPAEAELTYSCKHRQRVLSARAFPLATGIGVTWRDITNLRLAERRLARIQAEFDELAHEGPAAAWLTHANGRMYFINQAMVDALGRPAASLLGEGWMEAIDASDREAMLKARAQARATHGTFQYEGRFRRADGTLRLISLYGRPRFGKGGVFRGHVGTAVDVTELRDRELRQITLINELNHRIKNSFALVLSVVRQTLRERGTPRELEQVITHRLIVLSRAQEMLNRDDWESTELTDVAREVTGPLDHAGQISILGPKVRMSTRVAVAVSMALQELATNAVKYGGLSEPGGRVRLTWTKDMSAVDMEWRESGGPTVRPPEKPGAGSELFGQVLERELGRPADLDFEPDGLICRIRIPVLADSADFTMH